MRTKARDRAGGGPFAALLILLSLLLGSATAAAASAGPSGPASRLGSSRQGSAAALLPSDTRKSLGDEASESGNGPTHLPRAPEIVTEALPARPGGQSRSSASAARPRPAIAGYRARAPPAA